ncbi:hypothetical protein Tcan_17703 [Toxocara canis]|uniref:Uncharacterized protein n=1 Tax=Toxocara canis TaxID=6265 RepID=A0A0B2UWI0_TOXCA|nr:hypothetical protein Tcan_17703 [Toxocara canis]
MHLRKRIDEVRTELEACEREKNTFARLAEHEALAANKRLDKLNQEVIAQIRYAKLLREKMGISKMLIG